jgi:hypothetical protein
MKGNYSLPTIGGLRVNEISQIAELFEEQGIWDKVRSTYYETNISQTSKNATAKRYFSYMKGIITSWTDEELKIFLLSSFDEKKNFIWLAFCRLFPIAADFASTYVRKNTINGQLQMNIEDFRSYISKLVDSGKMEEPTKTVFGKGRSIIYKMLKEMGYYDGKTLQGGSLPSDFIKLVYSHNPEELHFFPISDQAIKRGLNS